MLKHQTCKACGRRDKFNFDVPDEVWREVVPTRLQNRVVCLACFDDFARERGVDYHGHLHTVYFAGERAALRLSVETARPVRNCEVCEAGERR